MVSEDNQNSDFVPCDMNLFHMPVTVLLTLDVAQLIFWKCNPNIFFVVERIA